MKTNIGILEHNRQKVATALTKFLADEFLLYTKTKTAHWNVEGIDFYEKHKLFEEQAQQLSDAVDTIAERIRSLDRLVPSSLSKFLELAAIKENALSKNDSKTFIQELLSDHETIIMELRKNITVFADELEDAGSSDFITGILQDHEKTAWILRAHLK